MSSHRLTGAVNVCGAGRNHVHRAWWQKNFALGAKDEGEWEKDEGEWEKAEKRQKKVEKRQKKVEKRQKKVEKR